jgi:hypothetical protein
MSDKTGAPEAPDPFDWNPPDSPRETWSDADWLRDMARANFVTEDIERADKIARTLEYLSRYKSVVESVIADFAERHAGEGVWQWAFASAIRERLEGQRDT